VASNPYAPPKAAVADIAGARIPPRLWNPNAAANWSLLFGPAFGAFLHMKNWQALEEPAKASAAKVWFLLTIVVLGSLVCASVVLNTTRRYLPQTWLVEATGTRGTGAFCADRGHDHDRRRTEERRRNERLIRAADHDRWSANASQRR
jgi:hypothetical protein